MADTKSNELDVSLESMSKSLQNSIQSIIDKAKYTNYNIAIKHFNTQGNNILGELYEIDITGETADCKKNTYIFVKQQIPQENFKLLSIDNAYSNELFFYKDLSKIFTSLQEEANVPLENRFKITNVYEESDNNAIIFDNLSKKGFRTYKKKEFVSIKYAQLAVEEMAKFHALNFVVEHKMPEYYNNKIKVLKNLFVFDDDWKGLMRNICAHVASLYDNDVKKRIEQFHLTLIEKLPKYCKDQTTVRCTLIHGDYKKSNLLVRTQNGEVVEVIPIDYQLINYGCPLLDFFLFIFTSTDREFRKKHLNDLKELYFKTLSSFLIYFDMDVETVYPKKEFEKDYADRLDFGLMKTLFFSFVIFAPDSEIKFEKETLSELPIRTDKKYDDLYRGLIDEFIEWGYL